MNLPSVITSGDSYRFTESFSDYSALMGWTSYIVLINADNKYTLNASADGNSFLFAGISNWQEGTYAATLFVKKSSERYKICESRIVVFADPEASENLDGRTASEKTLASLKLAYDEMIGDGAAVVQQVTINGRVTTFKTAQEVLMQITYWQNMVNAERAAKRMRSGRGFGGRILTRLS